eukprot:g14260.t1
MLHPPRPPEEADLVDLSSSSNRVGPLNLGGATMRSLTSAPTGDVVSKRTGPLAQIAGNTVSALSDVADRARAMAARSHDKDRHEVSQVSDSTERQETPSPDVGKPGSFPSSGSDAGAASSSSPKAVEESAAEPESSNAFLLGGHEDTGPENAPEALHSKMLEKLESEHAELFGDSLPLSTMPESFNRAVRKTLPALIPPAMAVFLTVSMPAVILLLKGVGTTLLAVARGYGQGSRRHSEGGYETGAAVEVGFGGGGGGGVGGRNHGASGTESPGSAFQMFLRRDGGMAGDAGKSGTGSGDGGERGGGLPVGESPDGAAVSAHPLPTQQIETDRHGFFSKRQQYHRGGVGSTREAGGFAVGDDAMAAMALAAMTQELSVMKQSLQAEVESMKTELQRASDDSKRLTDKLCRLEEDNRQLEAMVSRLGGQDARKLKAQLFSLLASPSMGRLGENGNTFSPQLSPT